MSIDPERSQGPPMTRSQVAKWLGISPRAVLQLVKQGKLAGSKVGQRWQFERANVWAYIKRQRAELEGKNK
jgi:excisionase family DNA binding protein